MNCLITGVSDKARLYTMKNEAVTRNIRDSLVGLRPAAAFIRPAAISCAVCACGKVQNLESRLIALKRQARQVRPHHHYPRNLHHCQNAKQYNLHQHHPPHPRQQFLLRPPPLRPLVPPLHQAHRLVAL